jgi:tetratricopeptide (TPR) repeat protein
METPQFLKRLLGLRDPRRAANLVAKGVVHARSGDLQAALGAYQKALAADDTYALAHLNVALALQDIYNEQRQSLSDEDLAQQLAEMEDHLRRALELDERLTPGFRALGYVERGLGNFRAARDAFTRYLDGADAKDPHRERVQLALAEVTDKAILQEHLEIGLAVVENAGADDATRADAEARLTKVVEQEPHRAQVWCALGVLRRTAKDAAGALKLMERALQADPGFVPAHRELSSMHFHAGRPAQALPHARAVYQDDPTNPAVVCNLGVCHLALGQLQDAQEFIALARNMAPKDPIVQDAVKAVEDATKAAAP